MSIVPLREIWVTANFKETQLEHMHPGTSGKVKVDTYGGRNWNAHVTVSRRRYRCKVQLAAAGERYRKLCEGGAAHSGPH